MRRRSKCSCTYAVALDAEIDPGDVNALASYLSSINSECEAIVFDPSFFDDYDERRRVLRWVARHEVALPHQRFADGTIDIVQAAAEIAATDKIIIASPHARYTAAEVRAMCDLLERHEAVEPEEYVQPLPWWGGLDAGRLLLHRGADHVPEERSTFAFRRSGMRGARPIDDRPANSIARRLGIDDDALHEARGLFVRREPARFGTWLRQRSREAASDLIVPMKSAFFLAVVPLLILLGVMGGAQMAGGYAGIMAFASVLLAIRGRAGAAKFFPLRACLFAPLSIAERSISMYWALFDRLRGSTSRTTLPPSMRTNARVASGE